MPNITLNTHVITKHDTATNWANSTYVPKDGELVIATRSDDDVDIKVGDGINITSNLSGTYKYQPLRYTTLNYGGFDRIMGSAYNDFITSPGIKVGDYAIMTTNQASRGYPIGSILRVNSINDLGRGMVDIGYNVVWSPLSASATPNMYCHSLSVTAQGRGSTSLYPNNIYISIPGVTVYSSKSNFTSSDFDNYPQMRVAGGRFTDGGPNHYEYDVSGAVINPAESCVTFYCTNGAYITFSYTGATVSSSYQV